MDDLVRLQDPFLLIVNTLKDGLRTARGQRNYADLCQLFATCLYITASVKWLPFLMPCRNSATFTKGGDGHADGQTDLGQYRHALRYACLKGPNPDILPRSGWPGGADEHGHHRQALYLVQATRPGQLPHHLDAWLWHWGTPCGVLVGFDSKSLYPWGMA